MTDEQALGSSGGNALICTRCSPAAGVVDTNALLSSVGNDYGKGDNVRSGLLRMTAGADQCPGLMPSRITTRQQ